MVNIDPPDIGELSQQKRQEIEQNINMLSYELGRFHAEVDAYFSQLLSDDEGSTTDWKNSHFSQIDPIEFENVVADLWEDMGYETTVTEPRKDGGADVIAVSQGALPINVEKLAIQVKRYTARRSVRQQEVDRMEAVRKRFDADLGLVVTTATFSEDAVSVESEDAMYIELVDGEELLTMLNSSSLDPKRYV